MTKNPKTVYVAPASLLGSINGSQTHTHFMMWIEESVMKLTSLKRIDIEKSKLIASCKI